MALSSSKMGVTFEQRIFTVQKVLLADCLYCEGIFLVLCCVQCRVRPVDIYTGL